MEGVTRGPTVNPLSDAIGADIRDIDPGEPLNGETVLAWHDHPVVLFPDRSLSDPVREHSCRHFGDLEVVKSSMRRLAHARTHFEPTGRRMLRRVAIEGARPI